MERILVIDDESTSLLIIESILKSEGFSVRTESDPELAVAEYKPGEYDLVLTDYYMPALTGDKVVTLIRKRDPVVPFVVMSAGTDLETIVAIMKCGIDDYILKPVNREDLLFRLRACIRDTRMRLDLRRVEEEKRLIQLESEKLVNWRMLYAYKDIHQTEQMINVLSRAINSSGGYAWLDIVNDLPKQEDGSVVLPGDILDLMVESATAQRVILEYLAFISKLPSMKLEIGRHRATAVSAELTRIAETAFTEVCGKHGHPFRLFVTGKFSGEEVMADIKTLVRVCNELVVNAIKYSPKGTEITMEIAKGTTDSITRSGGSGGQGGARQFLILFKNLPLELQAKDKEGKRIVGIPYDYSEPVFDLFFTIENFPTAAEEEEWSDGTGLYVVRKLLSKMGSTIGNSQIVDYSKQPPVSLVQFAVALPFAAG